MAYISAKNGSLEKSNKPSAIDGSCICDDFKGGTIQDKPTWSIGRIVNLFWGFLNLVFMFFKTLVNPNFNKKGNGYTSADFRPGPKPPRPPQRRMGGINRGGVDMSACAMGGGG